MRAWVLAIYVSGQLTSTTYHDTAEQCYAAGERATRQIERSTYVCSPNRTYRPQRDR